MRDAIAASALVPKAAGSITRWETASGPEDLDYYFYTGPWPVWKGYFTAPAYGAITIDQTTGQVHVPRTRPEIWLELYYKVHVVDWTGGIIKYRQKPALLAAIALGFLLLITGAIMQIRRWRRRKPAAGS